MGISGAQSAVQISASFITQRVGGFPSWGILQLPTTHSLTLVRHYKEEWSCSEGPIPCKVNNIQTVYCLVFPLLCSPPAVDISISHYDIQMYTTWGCIKWRQTEVIFYSCIGKLILLSWRVIIFHFYNVYSMLLPSLECLRTFSSIVFSTHADTQTWMTYLLVESNEKWKLLKLASRFVLLFCLNHASMWLK